MKSEFIVVTCILFAPNTSFLILGTPSRTPVSIKAAVMAAVVCQKTKGDKIRVHCLRSTEQSIFLLSMSTVILIT